MTVLLDLPTEILMQVISLLCPHCIIESQNLGRCTCQEERPPNSDNKLSNSAQLRKDLSSLSKTCKALQVLAQTALYHSPTPLIGRHLLLARTLASRHDLALHVKELHLGKWSVFEKDVTPELQDLFNDIINRVGVPPDLLKELEGEWPRDWLLDGGEGRETKRYVSPMPDITRDGKGKYFFDERVRVVDSLIVTLVPNVEHIHLEPLSIPHFPFCAPESLPRLTDFTLQLSHTSGGVKIDCVEGILGAAPALERFRGIGINGMSKGLTHSNLRSIDLDQSTLGKSHINAIMTGFPRLEIFGYEADYKITCEEREALPRDLGNALLIRKDTLKDVDIDLSRSKIYLSYTRLHVGDAMPSLKEMVQLESLGLDRDVMFVPRELRADGDLDGDDESETDNDDVIQNLEQFGMRKNRDLVVDFLPPSIRYFKLYDRHGLLFPDLVKLAETAPEKFPALKKVRFWGFDEDQRMALRGSFRRVGVKCTHGGYL
ncbi:aromatic aminotransferase [Colletotrichum truncatum]|uniref:Aromatic aminotransferase n=1 Tax=Colletotrichum truncatum TaxID=5467 RepID=A0ACC3Z3F2_COLTU|nr:aromatic aminotransferase [Colletotrichum truncatum]KAF6793184.1 aromatic aminotransferase [Colletotrichum truncatum]